MLHVMSGAVFHALGGPHRQAMVKLVRDHPCPVEGSVEQAADEP